MPDFLINHSHENNGQLSEKLNNQEYHKSYQNGVFKIGTEVNGSQFLDEHPPLTISFNPSTETGRVSLLLSSKALVQLILNPFIGIVTNRVGYSLPLFFGTCILLTSAIGEY